jgi:hypothetical protein
MNSPSRVSLWIVVVMMTLAGVLSTAQQSKEALTFGIYTGASVPSESIGSIYEALESSSLASSYQSASDLGVHFGGRIRFGLSDKLSFSGSAAFCRFAGQDQTAVLASGQTLTLQTATTLVPISAGVTAFAFRGLVAPYITAEASYTYRTVAVATGNSLLQDIIVNGAKVELEPSSRRIGAALAAGVQLDIGGLQPFAELRYHWVNLAGTDAGEDRLSFLNVSIGLLF